MPIFIIHADSCIFMLILVYSCRFLYIHADSYIFMPILIIHADSYIILPIFANFCIPLLIQMIVTIVTKVIFNWLTIRLHYLFIYFFKPFTHRSRSLSFLSFSSFPSVSFYFPFCSFLLSLPFLSTFPSISFVPFCSFHSLPFLSFPSVPFYFSFHPFYFYISFHFFIFFSSLSIHLLVIGFLCN